MGNKLLTHTCTPDSFPENFDLDLAKLHCAVLARKTKFDDRYEVDDSQPIGTGKFAQVFLCWAKNQPDQRYALKVIQTPADDHATLNRIYDEIKILRVLGDHPSIIQLVDVNEVRGSGCISLVADLCEGGELYSRLEQKGFYPEMEGKTLVRNLLEAVVYIHSKGIMHRDLKPENILLVSKDDDTNIKISDFGLAKMSKDFPNRLPRSASICGSDFYLAPEVIKQEEYGREVDIWAVGVITYCLLSGSLPFHHDCLHKLYRQIMERDVYFPDAQWRKVSKGSQDFILRLLQVRSGDRLTAEQALEHPWLRGRASVWSVSPSDVNSFANQNSSDQKYVGASLLVEGSQDQYPQKPESPRTSCKNKYSLVSQPGEPKIVVSSQNSKTPEASQQSKYNYCCPQNKYSLLDQPGATNGICASLACLAS